MAKKVKEVVEEEKKNAKEEKKSLLERIKKNSTIKESAILSKSIYFNVKDMIDTGVPMINVALSGKLDGGLTSGLTMFAGPSKNFKTAFSLLMAKAYMEKYPDAIMLFYDGEFGTPLKYFMAFDIDMSRVIHSPFTDIEQLKFDIVNQLQEINRGDKIIILIDSVGNAASKKEIDDALEKNSVSDMTRAKQIKSLFRMVTPHLNLKDIPLIVVNHTYKELSLYPKDIVSGGTGPVYSADNIFIIGRQQDKDGKELMGYDFIINVEKSRFVKEKSKIPISVSFENGIERYSGLIEVALEGGFIMKPSNGWYAKVDLKTGEIGPSMRLADTMTGDFWKPFLEDVDFKTYVNKKYEIAYGSILSSGEKINLEVDEDVRADC